MSTPEQPATPPLTRKQMREIRNTGSNAVITAEAEPEAAAETAEHDAAAAPEVEPAAVPAPVAAREPAPAPVAPLARAAEPVVIAEQPVPDAAVDLGVSPLTRRQARQQERIRTASVPVITPEIAAAYSAAVPGPVTGSSPASADDRPDTAVRELFGLPATGAVDVESTASDAWAATGEEGADEILIVEPDADEGSHEPEHEPQPDVEQESTSDDSDASAEGSDRAVVNPMFGAELLAGDPAEVELPPSFDQLLSRSSGTGGTPHALIMSQASPAGPIVAPVTATGEVLITGTLNLPEGLGSNGHAPGATDGKEIDASLVDGEIPAHSSPTPIAASAAISTVKNSGEIIKPPLPEKGSKLMMTLAITAGVLALALVGVLILAFWTGVF